MLPSTEYLSRGPTTNPIFMGHFKNGTSAEKTESSDAERKTNEKDSDGGFVEEVHFNYGISIEGIHVVPNRINPPGLPFSGRTKPEMHERPFLLEIFGRQLPEDGSTDSTPAVQLLLAVTISGGVQWLPLAGPQNSWKVDYLAIGGDFEEVSVIIHGVEYKDINTMATFLPQPTYYDGLIEVLKAIPQDASTDKTVAKLVQVELTQLSDVLQVALPRGNAAGVKSLLPASSTTFAGSYVWLSEAAQLVEAIFSYSSPVTPAVSSEAIQTDLQYLEQINSLVESCWETSRIALSEDYDTVEACLGEEALNLLASTVGSLVRGLPERLAAAPSTAEGIAQVALYGVALLKAARLLLAHEMSALEMVANGGLQALCDLLFTSLPRELQAEVLWAMYYAARHFPVFLAAFCAAVDIEAALMAGRPPQSPYQRVVCLLSSCCSPILQAPGRLLLAMCDFQNSLHALSTQFLAVLDSLQVLGRVIADHCAHSEALNITSSVELWDEDSAAHEANAADAGNSIAAALFDACKGLVHVVADAAKAWAHLSGAWDRVVVLHDAKKYHYMIKCTEDHCIETSLVASLRQSGFLGTVVGVYRLLAIVRETQLICSHNPHYTALATATKAVRTQFVAFMSRLGEYIPVWVSAEQQESMMFVLQDHWRGDGVDAPGQPCAHQALLYLRSASRQVDEGAVMTAILTSVCVAQRANAAVSQGLKVVNDLAGHMQRGDADESVDEQMVHFLTYQHVLLQLMAHEVSAQTTAAVLVYHSHELMATLQRLLTALQSSERSEGLHSLTSLVLLLVRHGLGVLDLSKDQFKLYQALLEGMATITQTFAASSSNETPVFAADISGHLSKINSFVHWAKAPKDRSVSRALTPALVNSDKQTHLFVQQLARRHLTDHDNDALVSLELVGVLDGLRRVAQALVEVRTKEYWCFGQVPVDESALERMGLNAPSLEWACALLQGTAAQANVALVNILRIHLHLTRAMLRDARRAPLRSAAFRVALVKSLVELYVLYHHANPRLRRTALHNESAYQRRRSLVVCVEELLTDIVERSDEVVPEALSALVDAYGRAYPLYTAQGAVMQALEVVLLVAKDSPRPLGGIVWAAQASPADSAQSNSLPAVLQDRMLRCQNAADCQQAARVVVATSFFASDAAAGCDRDLVRGLLAKYAQLRDAKDNMGLQGCFCLRYLHALRALASASRLAAYWLVHQGAAPMLLQHIRVILDNSAEPTMIEVAIVASCVEVLLAILRHGLALVASCAKDFKAPADSTELWLNCWHLVVWQVSEALAALLPRVLKRFFLLSNALIQLCLCALNEVFSEHNQRVFLLTINAIGEGFTFEFVAVKLWGLVEDSFQQVHEMLDVFRLLAAAPAGSGGADADKASNLMYAAHGAFTSALHVLRGMLDAAVWGLERGLLGVNSVNKALRSHMMDPKKVIIRYQRVYTMWATSARLHTSARVHRVYTNDAAAAAALEASLVEEDKFDARHLLVTMSFKSLLDLVSKYASVANAPPTLKVKVEPPSAVVDLGCPFSVFDEAAGAEAGVLIRARLLKMDAAAAEQGRLVSDELFASVVPDELLQYGMDFPVQLALAHTEGLDKPARKRKVAEALIVRTQARPLSDMQLFAMQNGVDVAAATTLQAQGHGQGRQSRFRSEPAEPVADVLAQPAPSFVQHPTAPPVAPPVAPPMPPPMGPPVASPMATSAPAFVPPPMPPPPMPWAFGGMGMGPGPPPPPPPSFPAPPVNMPGFLQPDSMFLPPGMTSDFAHPDAAAKQQQLQLQSADVPPPTQYRSAAELDPRIRRR